MAVEKRPPRMDRGADYAITASNVGVKYDLRFTRKTTVRGSIAQMLGRGHIDKFWALRNVDLHVRRGESLAVIGPNGAGKSTLLQVLAGIIHPSEGAVDVFGHVSGLLTLGAGFDKDLTGRDNILLGGAFLGLDDHVTRELLPSIIDYAELGEFIEAPLKTYSSGMRARLGFAIATSVDPDILLLDEVLATGDANFRAKSKTRVLDIVGCRQGGRPRHPRHGLGDRVLQPGHPHRAGRRGHGGRAGRGGRAPPGASGRGPRPERRGRNRGRCRSADREGPLRDAQRMVSGGGGSPRRARRCRRSPGSRASRAAA